jgi:N-acetylmuramoyl-L-alanine amidase
MRLVGRCSWFGGPDDTGVSETEGLALCEEHEIPLFDADLFLTERQAGAPGLARRLNPDYYYAAMRWDYDTHPREWLQTHRISVTNPDTGITIENVQPIDWGPHIDTGRLIDLSPALLADLHLQTDDPVTVEVPDVPDVDEEGRAITVVISSGHSLVVRGASGIIDEVDEARRVVPEVASHLADYGFDVVEIHDDVSETQEENLEWLVSEHNKHDSEDRLDVSIHFNAYVPTATGRGTECLFFSQDELAEAVSMQISEVSGLLDRGAHQRLDLYFLKHTNGSLGAILVEVCFVDSTEDCLKYDEAFAEICEAIARAIRDYLT